MSRFWFRCTRPRNIHFFRLCISSTNAKNLGNSYCVGDGEMQEGQIWESILFAGVKKIKNLCVIVDNNKFQNEVSVNETLGDISLEDKIKSFGWQYISVDGHSLNELYSFRFKNNA